MNSKFIVFFFFFFQAEDGIRDHCVTGVQTCALPICIVLCAMIANSTIRLELQDSTFWPEGIDYDPTGKKFYVASIRHRTILEHARNGEVRELLPRRDDIGAVMGVRVDPRGGVVWATTAGIPQM